MLTRATVVAALSCSAAAVVDAQEGPSAFTGDALVAFRTAEGTYFSSMTRLGILAADATAIGRGEQFRLVPLGSGKYALQTFGNGLHLTATGGGGMGAGGVTTQTAGIGQLEVFTLACSTSGWCALRTSGGYYLATSAGNVRTDAATPGAAGVFRVLTPQSQQPVASPGAPTSRAKTGAILGQIAGPIVQGSVGHDRFGGWEDALAAGFGRGRAGATSTSAYSPYVVAQGLREPAPLVSVDLPGDDDSEDPRDPPDPRPTAPPAANQTEPQLFKSMSEEETSDYSWKSTWTRRGSSNIYDAAYTGPQGQSGTTVNTVSVQGNRFTARRTQSADGNLCSYEGTIQPDRSTVRGTYTCNMGSTRPWRGTLNW